MKIGYVSVFSYLHGIHVLIRVVSRFFFFQFCDIENLANFPQNFSKRGRLYTRETKMSQKIPCFGKKTITGCCWLHKKTISSVHYLQTNIWHICHWCFFFFGKYFLSFCPICQILMKIYIIARFVQQFFQQVAKI